MRQPGVEVRGITQPDGTAEFCEVFFDDARCPKDNVVGGVNNGWKVANSTLGVRARAVGHDRATGASRRSSACMIDAGPRERLASTTRTIRQRLAALLHEDPDPAHQRAAHRCRATLTGSQGPRRRSRSARRTRCSGRRCTRRRWSSPSTSSAPTSMLVDAGPGVGFVAGRARDDKRREGYPVSPMMSAFFFSRSRRSGAAPARSSATSSASVCSASRRSPSPPDDDLSRHADVEALDSSHAGTGTVGHER